MSAIPDSVQTVAIKTAEKKIETISEHLLNMSYQVLDAGCKSYCSEQYEVAFLDLLVANQGSPMLVKN
jgi:hypothetical protein